MSDLSNDLGKFSTEGGRSSRVPQGGAFERESKPKPKDPGIASRPGQTLEEFSTYYNTSLALPFLEGHLEDQTS